MPWKSLDEFGLLEHLGNHAGADGAAAFADGEPDALFQRHRHQQLNVHLHIVPRHHHLHAGFLAAVYLLGREEGGRHTPVFSGYRPQFYFRTTDVTGSLELPAGTEMVMPGDNIKMTVTLGAPIAMEEKLRFAIREGGRTVGAGVVAKIIE